MTYVRRFARFWYDFVVGDDWLVAVGIGLALGLTALLADWWVLPVAVMLLLAASLLRATR